MAQQRNKIRKTGNVRGEGDKFKLIELRIKRGQKS